MSETYYKATTTQEIKSNTNGVKSSWGGPIPKGSSVFFRVAEAWSKTYEDGSTLDIPKRVIVLSHHGYAGTRMSIPFDQAAAYLKTDRYHGKPVIDDEGNGAKIDDRIEWELNR